MCGIELGLTPEERGLAAALDDSLEALEELVQEDTAGAFARRHRAGAALYLRAATHHLTAPTAWHTELLAMAARHLQLESTVQEVADLLGASGIEWMPLKGYDVATRAYGAPEERPTSDLDLLILPECLDEARRLLATEGWEGAYAGPRNERFLKDEGYAWMAHKPGRTFMELHFRLWGLVPEDFARALFERAQLDETLAGGRRAALADAYLIAAVHVWLSPPPRPLVAWWDLARLADRLENAETAAVVDSAHRWEVELPVALAAEVSAALWGRPACRRIAHQLAGKLRFAERRIAERARRRGLCDLSLAPLQAARLISGRQSRQGWRGAWRRIWAHPGIVERQTPEEWPWIRRRLTYQIRSLRRP